MTKDNSYKKYNAIDILKLVLAVLVMVIHSGIDKTVLSPVLRTAVPLFFIISGYFFFSKNRMLLSGRERNAALAKFAKRNLFLYLFWSVIQFPIWFFIRGYYQDGFIDGMLIALKGILLGGGFTGGWYIVALVIGVVLVFLASKKISAIWLVLLTLPLFIFSCLLTNYYNLFDENSFVISSGNWYHMLTGMHFYTSFPVALFWVSLGRFLAEKKFAIESSILWIAGVLFAGLLAVERYFVVKFSLGITDDCYFMLALICPVIFLLVREIGVTIITRLPIREMSVILYVTHGCFGRVVGHLLKAFPINDFIQVLLKMLLSLIVSYVLFLMIRWLKEKKNIKMLEFAY